MPNQPPAKRPRRWSSALGRSSEIRILAVALILCIYFEAVNHDFLLTGASLQNLSQFIAPVAIIAFGEIMLMIGGEIDLSAGMVLRLRLSSCIFLSRQVCRHGLRCLSALLPQDSSGSLTAR